MAVSNYIQEVMKAAGGRNMSTAWFRNKIKELGDPTPSQLLRDGDVSSTPFDRKQKRGSFLSKSAAAYTKLAKDNPALGGVAGIAAYDIGKGILGKVKKYTKAIVKSLNVEKPTKTGRISAGT